MYDLIDWPARSKEFYSMGETQRRYISEEIERKILLKDCSRTESK